MQKKRVTRLSTKEKESSLNEFKFQHQLREKQQPVQKPQRRTKAQNFARTKPKPIHFSNEQLEVQNPKATQNQNSNQSIEKGIKQIKKKKVTKKEQNQGIRILQQRQNQKIFQHLCNPDGLITIESLGRIMVRAKKDFEIEDLQNMISYYDTIKKKLQTQTGQTQSQGNKTKKMNRNKKQNVQKIQSLSQLEEDQDSQQNFEDELDQSDNQQIEVEAEKSELTFEEFKILKNYFEK